VDPDPPHWVIGGFSYGGTCAIQMATNHPSGYPNFVDISGQLEPTLGSRQRTANSLFGGDPARFTAINPIDLLGRRNFPALRGGSSSALPGHRRRPLAAVGCSAWGAGMDVWFWQSPAMPTTGTPV